MPRSTKSAEMIKAQAETIDQLTVQLVEANAEIERLKRLAPAPKAAKPAYVPRPVDPEVLRRRELMAAAREAAMSGGRAVRVEW